MLPKTSEILNLPHVLQFSLCLSRNAIFLFMRRNLNFFCGTRYHRKPKPAYPVRCASDCKGHLHKQSLLSLEIGVCKQCSPGRRCWWGETFSRSFFLCDLGFRPLPSFSFSMRGWGSSWLYLTQLRAPEKGDSTERIEQLWLDHGHICKGLSWLLMETGGPSLLRAAPFPGRSVQES